MSADIYKKVRANPKFAELEGKRSRFALMLTAIVMVSYYGMMALVAFAPDALRTPISSGATLTIGVPIGAVIIIGSWLLKNTAQAFAPRPDYRPQTKFETRGLRLGRQLRRQRHAFLPLF